MKNSVMWVSGVFLAVAWSMPGAYALDITPAGSFGLNSLSTDRTMSDTSSGVINEGLSSGTSLGAGVLISQQITSSFSVESGVMYLPRSFSQNFTNLSGVTGTMDYDYAYWQLPVVIRYSFASMFSVGFGGYYAHAMGNIKATPSGGVFTTTAVQYVGYEDNGVSRTDDGLIFAAGAKVPLGSTFSFFGDLRYDLGLKNIDNNNVTTLNTTTYTTDTNKWSDFQILFGVSFRVI